MPEEQMTRTDHKKQGRAEREAIAYIVERRVVNDPRPALSVWHSYDLAENEYLAKARVADLKRMYRGEGKEFRMAIYRRSHE